MGFLVLTRRCLWRHRRHRTGTGRRCHRSCLGFCSSSHKSRGRRRRSGGAGSGSRSSCSCSRSRCRCPRRRRRRRCRCSCGGGGGRGARGGGEGGGRGVRLLQQPLRGQNDLPKFVQVRMFNFFSFFSCGFSFTRRQSKVEQQRNVHNSTTNVSSPSCFTNASIRAHAHAPTHALPTSSLSRCQPHFSCLRMCVSCACATERPRLLVRSSGFTTFTRLVEKKPPPPPPPPPAAPVDAGTLAAGSAAVGGVVPAADCGC